MDFEAPLVQAIRDSDKLNELVRTKLSQLNCSLACGSISFISEESIKFYCDSCFRKDRKGKVVACYVCNQFKNLNKVPSSKTRLATSLEWLNQMFQGLRNLIGSVEKELRQRMLKIYEKSSNSLKELLTELISNKKQFIAEKDLEKCRKSLFNLQKTTSDVNFFKIREFTQLQQTSFLTLSQQTQQIVNSCSMMLTQLIASADPITAEINVPSFKQVPTQLIKLKGISSLDIRLNQSYNAQSPGHLKIVLGILRGLSIIKNIRFIFDDSYRSLENELKNSGVNCEIVWSQRAVPRAPQNQIFEQDIAVE